MFNALRVEVEAAWHTVLFPLHTLKLKGIRLRRDRGCEGKGST